MFGHVGAEDHVYHHLPKRLPLLLTHISENITSFILKQLEGHSQVMILQDTLIVIHERQFRTRVDEKLIGQTGMIHVVNASGEKRGRHFQRSENRLQRRRVQQHVRALRDVRRVQRVVERIVLHVMILQRHHEVDERLRRYHHLLEQVAGREGGVRDASQRASVAQLADPEDVDAPAVDVHEALAQVFFVGRLHPVHRQALARERVRVTQRLPVHAGDLGHGGVRPAAGTLFAERPLHRFRAFFHSKGRYVQFLLLVCSKSVWCKYKYAKVYF